MPAVEVRGLRKSYADRTVIAELDLHIDRGECFALLGPNGAGKTTSVEILEGFRTRDAGNVRVLDHDPAEATRAWRARLGVVGQSIGAASQLTVEETLRHFAHYHARPRDAEELLELLDLEEQAGVRVSNLSGGQRRRLDVALGVQGNPELLFLDEPTTGLDPASRRRFWTLIAELRDQGTTILLTTHYLDEAARLADRVAVISRGRLLETAPPALLGAELRTSTTIRWTGEGSRHEQVTDMPSEILRDLLARTPGELTDLEVLRPTLEDVYLAMLEAADADERPREEVRA